MKKQSREEKQKVLLATEGNNFDSKLNKIKQINIANVRLWEKK
jgi:hypothetical protein